MTTQEKFNRLRTDVLSTFSSGMVIGSRETVFRTREGGKPLCGIEAAAYIYVKWHGRLPKEMPDEDTLCQWFNDYYELGKAEVAGLRDGFWFVGPLDSTDKEHFIAQRAKWEDRPGYSAGFRTGRDLGDYFESGQMICQTRFGRVAIITHHFCRLFRVWVGHEQPDGTRQGHKWFKNRKSESEIFDSLPEAAAEAENFLVSGPDGQG